MAKNTRQTALVQRRLQARLASPNATKPEKSAAASALSQTPSRKK